MLRRTACALVTITTLAFACAQRAELAKEGDGSGGFVDPDASRPDSAPRELGVCPSNECPAGRTTCKNDPYPCAVDLRSDDDNCGACGHHCPHDEIFIAEFHAISRCVDGVCRLTCAQGTADCNGLADDGCETRVALDKNNCGACGVVCADMCADGECGCPSRFTFCKNEEDAGSNGGITQSACRDLSVDPANCGSCGNVCPPSAHPPRPPEWHQEYGCTTGVCDRLHCATDIDFVANTRHDWENCNGNAGTPADDGCETDIANDSKNCGACGLACAPGLVCRPIPQGRGGECICPCGSSCFQINSDVDNCGVCNLRCPGDRRSLEPLQFPGADPDPAHGRPVCNQGICDYRCSPNWADCDGDDSNGCETNLLEDPLHCGACGARCKGIEGQPCVDGKCLTKECEKGIQ